MDSLEFLDTDGGIGFLNFSLLNSICNFLKRVHADNTGTWFGWLNTWVLNKIFECFHW